MAALAIPAHGYGIRYDHGMFRQVIRDGRQQEFPENWLSFGNPWEFARPDLSHMVGFGGSVELQHRHRRHAAGRSGIRPRRVVAVAYDTPVIGWRGQFVNTLRLWSARARRPADAGRVQPRRPCRRAGGRRPRQRHLADPLSQRRDPRRPGTAAAAGVFLLLRVVAEPGVPPPPAAQGRAHAGAVLRHPAQRHASRHRRAGADAAAGGRARTRAGTKPGASPGRRSATPTTPCCRRRWKAGRCR